MARTFAASATASAVLLSLAASVGCNGTEDPKQPFEPPPLLYVTPRSVDVVAGREAVTFAALLRGPSGTVAWSLEPAGVGALSTASGAFVAYLPPASVAATTTVTLTARAAGMSDSAVITVTPPSPPTPSLTVTPGTACIVAGDGPTTFAARLENAYGAISWSLEPAGVGNLSAASGGAVEYTPPASLEAPAIVKVVATGAGLTGSATVSVAAQAPGQTPVVATLSPERAVAGGAGLALTVDGAGFIPGTMVRWNGVDRATAFVGCTRVVASIPQVDVARAGTAQVSVVNPGQIGSNAASFAIDHRLVTRVSVASNGTAGNSGSFPNIGLRPATSADGRYVVFASWASNLVPGDIDQNGEIFLRDTCFGAPPGCAPGTERVSLLAYNLLHNDDATITPDGRFVAFVHLGATGSQGGIYVRDTCRGAPPGCTPSTEYASLPVNGWAPLPSWEGAYWGLSPAISSGGRFVAFYSEWSLVPEDDPASGPDAYVRDTCRGAPAGCTPTTALVSIGPAGAVGGLDEYASSIGISADGRYVSFVTAAGALAQGDTKGLPDMFLRDTCNGAPAGCVPATERVSVGSGGEEGNGPTHHGSLGSSGRFVAFASEASNLVPGDANALLDVFVRDTCHEAPPGCTPATELVSLASDGMQGDGRSAFPQTSADGRFVVFWSEAANLVPGDTNGVTDIFLRDTCRGAGPDCTPSTIRLSSASDGSQASNPAGDPPNWGSASASISADGRVVVLRSGASNLVPGDAREWDVFLIATCVDASSFGCGPSGSLRVTTTATGVDVDPDGFLIRLHRLGTGSWDAATVPVQGTSTISALPPDTYEATLAGVAANCDAVTPTRATVVVAAGETAQVSFDVACAAATLLAFEYAHPGSYGTTLHRGLSNGTGTFEIDYNGSWSEWNPAWSTDGRIAFTSEWHHSICAGTPTWIPSPPYFLMGAVCLDDPATAYQPSWSPDGSRLAFVSERDGNPEIYLVNADWTSPVRLTSDPADDRHPAWSPDGTRIAFARSGGAGSRIWVMNADGSSAAPLTSDLVEETTPAWSPDGTRIAYSRRGCRDGPAGRECDPWDILVRDPDGTSQPVAMGSALADALDPAWSPDGRKIAYSYRLRDSATELHDHASAIAVVRVDGSGPDLSDPLRDEFIFSVGEHPAWRP